MKKSAEPKMSWAKSSIRVSTAAFEDGMKAGADRGKSLNDCPHNGWTVATHQQRLDWCAGFTSTRWPNKAKKKRAKQLDIEKDAGA